MRSAPARADRASEAFDEHAVADYPRLMFICAWLLLMADPGHSMALSVAVGMLAGVAFGSARRHTVRARRR